MTKAFAIAGALLIATAGAAFAQNSGTSGQPNASESATSTSKPSGPQIRDRLIQNLKQSGFTNVQVQAESFLVRAKDKDGDPVMMVVNPDSVTEVVGSVPGSSTEGRSSASGATSSQNNANGAKAGHAGPSNQ